MGSLGNQKPNRVLAWAMALLLLFLLCASSCFLAMEAGHVCEEEDCAVCACMELCETILQQMGVALVAAATAVLFSAVLFIVRNISSQCSASTTLVSCKVRLND